MTTKVRLTSDPHEVTVFTGGNTTARKVHVGPAWTTWYTPANPMTVSYVLWDDDTGVLWSDGSQAVWASTPSVLSSHDITFYQSPSWFTTATKTVAISWAEDDVIVVGATLQHNLNWLNTPQATGLTFVAETSAVNGAGDEPGVWIWTATATAPGSSDVVLSQGGGGAGAKFGMAIWVVSGGSAGIGVSYANQTETATNLTVEASSTVLYVAGDQNFTNTNETPTAGSGTATERAENADATFGYYAADWAGVHAGTFAFGQSSYTGMKIAQAAVEIKAPVPPTNLIWAEEFDTLDMTTSSHTGAWRPNDFWQNIDQGYRDFAGTNWNLNPNQHPADTPFAVASSVLTITAKRTPSALNASIAATMAAQGVSGSVPAWCGAFMQTNRDVRTFRYAYFEIKARWPNPGKGMFPALWLYATKGDADPLDKGCAEIDILEIFGYAAGQPWSANLHYRNNANTPIQDPVALPNQSSDTTEWHVYGLDWQPTYLRWYRDNVLVHEVTGFNAEWFNTTMGLRLNFAMDASWFASTETSDGTTPDPMTMQIDYVRVYATRE